MASTGTPGAGAETRRRFMVGGSVQGVGFRAWTVRRASELGLRGTVRNCADGRVEVEAAGPPPDVDRLRALLERGPSFARVTTVTEVAPRDSALPRGFQIGM